MKKKSSEPISAAEWEIMKIVWEKKSCTAREVYEIAGRTHGWAASTVKTMLRRLVEKGHLKTQPSGNSFIYSPSQSAEKMLFKSADTLLHRALDGTVGPLLAYMVKRSRLSQSELDELRSLLDERQGEREE